MAAVRDRNAKTRQLPLLDDVKLVRPFLKWPGAKNQLVSVLLRRAPRNFKTYYEPFLGSGVLFFALRPERAVLSDINRVLIRTFEGVRDHPEEVISRVRCMPRTEEFYYSQRELSSTDPDVIGLAAKMIFLMAMSFNGLFRVNRRGEFNVPIGTKKPQQLTDEINLRLCSRLLSVADFRDDDFEAVAEGAREGDFVYFDPPYIPITKTAPALAYSALPFRFSDQRRLRQLALRLKKRGVHVLISNSIAPEVLELYGSDFDIQFVSARRNISGRLSGRGVINETLIS